MLAGQEEKYVRVGNREVRSSSENRRAISSSGKKEMPVRKGLKEEKMNRKITQEKKKGERFNETKKFPHSAPSPSRSFSRMKKKKAKNPRKKDSGEGCSGETLRKEKGTRSSVLRGNLARSIENL